MAQSSEQRKIDIIMNGQQVNASLKEMGAAAALMNAQLRKMSADDPGREKLKKDFHDMRGRIDNVKQELYGVEKASHAAKLGFSDMSGIMKTVMGTAGGILVGGGIENLVGTVVGFFGDSSTAAKEFEASLSNLSAITGATGEDLRFYEEQAQLIGQTTSLSASQAVEAFKLIGSAKPELLGNKEALAAVTQEAIALAEAAGMELPEAANSLASSLNQFGAGADEAGRFINVLAAGAKEGSSEITETAAALKNAGTVASGAGLSFEETNAAIQSLAEISIKGGEAGTGLRNVLLTLQSGADDTNPAVVGLEKAMENLGKKNLSTAELAKLFGKENVVVANQLVNSRSKITELTAAMTGTSTAYEQAATNMDNLEGDLKSLDSATESLQIGLGKGLNVAIREGVKLMTGFVLAVKEAPAFLRENKDVIITLGAAILALNAGNIKAAASTLYHNAVEKGRAIATRASAAAQWVLNAAMTANPIGLVVAAVAALVGGFVILYNRSEAVRGGINGLGKAFMELISLAADIGSFLLNPLKNAGKIQEIMNAGDRLGKAFSDGYNQKIASEKVSQEKKEQADHEQKKKEAEKKGEEIGAAKSKGDAKAQKEREKKDKQLQAERERDQLEAVKKIQNLEDELIADEFDRKIAQLRTNADREKAEAKGKDEQIAEQRKLIEAKLAADIAALEKERADKKDKADQEQLEKDKKQSKEKLDIANKEAKAQADLDALKAKKGGGEEYQKALLAQLETERTIQLANTELTAAEKLLLEEQFEQKKQEIKDQFAEAAHKKELEKTQFMLENMMQATNLLFDFKKIANDKELAQNDQATQQRLQRLDQEYKSGKISKEQYESSKSAIEANYDVKTRELKRKAAQDEKKANIANSIMAGALAVLKASQNPLGMLSPTAIMTAIFAGLQTAKIIATPIPAFAKGGFTSGKKNGTFAAGGWINEPQLGLIGEAGRELVLPNWMVESPKYANIVGYLEAERQKGTRAFAAGGMTTGPAPVLPISENEERALTKFEKELLREVREMKEEVAAWPNRLLVQNDIADIRKKIQVLNDLEKKAFG